MKILERKRELYSKWTKLYKDLDRNKMSRFRYEKLRKIETEDYKRWRFFDNYVKTKEKMDYEKN